MQQSMQISLLCSTEHKEENMIFVNSPFKILDEAFRDLYPDKKYKACIEPSIKDDEGNRVFGFTQFSKGETPVIAISAELSITDATEIFAHELAHVAAGEGAGHGERWDEEFQRIFDEYNRIGRERFGEEGKEIETAPEYRGGWIRSEDRMPEEGEDVLVWFEYFRFGNYPMAKKMSDEEMLEAMEQAVKMHFMAFQQFMKQTGGDIGLSLQLTTSYTAAMLKGSQEQNEKEEKLLKLLLPSGKNNLTN